MALNYKVFKMPSHLVRPKGMSSTCYFKIENNHDASMKRGNEN